MSQPPSLVALRQRREQTIARLCELFARDHLEAHELEQLIDRAHQATSLAELDQLVAGFPAADPPRPTVSPAASPRTGQDQQYILAVMGGAERRGAWHPARQIYVTALMGGACLDFRDAVLDPGVTEVYVLALMGGVEITVAPGTRVESNGIGIMGGFAHAGTGRTPVDTSVPVLRITGLALMGGVEIRDRPSGETAEGYHDRRRELRETRRELRDAHRKLRGGSRPRGPVD